MIRYSYRGLPPQLIDRLATNQCISTGVFESNKTKIVRDDDLTSELINQGVRSRSKKYMGQPDVGLILLDHDIGPDMPQQLRCESSDKLMSILCEAAPQLASVAYSGAGSCSSGIRVTATGTANQGGGGHHVYIVVQGVDLKKLNRYLPKGSDLSGFTQEELDAIAWKLNTRPHKSLGFRCPAELFTPDAFDFRQHHAALFALGH